MGERNGAPHRAPLPVAEGPRPAVTRRRGRTAELAALRARVDMARMLGDAGEERAAAGALAERLASRDQELDLAVELVRKTLTGGDDPALRHRLAGWLERLGEPILAAAELRRLPDEEDAVRKTSRLVRIGVLHARGGDAAGAVDALTEAAETDPADPLPLELMATIPAWAPEVVGARDGADAYVRAARRRAAERDVEHEVEDLLRAVELDPASAVAVAALAAKFAATARPAAADLVLRRHAEARLASGEDHEAQAVHEQRLDGALASGDLARALFAAFDAGLDASEAEEDVRAFDALLARASAFELLAARLEVRAELRAPGRVTSSRWSDLGRLAAGPLAATERALEAYGRAVVADPENADAVHALRALARRSGSTTWLVEGLVRAALSSGPETTSGARLAAARALVEVADDVREPLLGGWAHGVVASLDPSDQVAAAAHARSETALRRRDEEVALARRALETSADGAKIGLLGDLARLLRSAPDRSRELASVLVELSSFLRDDDLVLWEAVRLCERVGDVDAVVALCRERLARPPEPPRLRVLLVCALRRAGRLEESSAAAKGLAAAVTPWAYAEAWVTARLAGDAATAAEALAALAPTCGSPAAAALGTLAGEGLARAGRSVEARRALELAWRAEPDDPRAASALAGVVPEGEDRVAAAALENAIEVGYPTAAACLRLADSFERMGEPGAALAWAKRAVTLRPGFSTATEALVARALRTSDLAAAVVAIEWLLPQPEPARVMAERAAAAVRAITERDPARACEVSRRALEIVGPRSPNLRDAVDVAARAAGQGDLRAVVRERWLASGAPAAERASGVLELGAIYAELGDTDRELSAYLRAAREGVDLTSIGARVRAMAELPLSPDAELARLEVYAELALDQGRTDEAITGFREVGAAFWDLADDRARAVQAWMRAAQLDSARGYATLRGDLVAVADASYAVEVLAELAEREADRSRAAMVATEAARAALEAHEPARALGLARLALEKHAGHGEALELAEVAARAVGRAHEMSPLYDHVARRALGRFGRRAAHHRAARFFAEGGVAMLALKHAAQAFIAVPSEGSTLELLRRTSDQAQRRSIAVRTVEHVAELAKTNGVRAGWLLRAAALASPDLEGTRQKVDLFLRAVVLSPSPVTMAMLSASSRDLLGLAPEDGEGLVVRLGRASEAIAKDLEGPDGARIAITFAEMAIGLLGDGGWALRLLDRAMNTDADVDEYAGLVHRAPSLARAPGAKEALDAAFASIDKPYANVGVALLRLVGALARELGDPARAARALVTAVEKDEDDDLAVAEADEALRAFPDETLAARFARRVSAQRRYEALRGAARRARQRGDDEAATQMLTLARASAPEQDRAALDEELSAALAGAGRVEEAVELALASGNVPEGSRAARWEELAQAREQRGDATGAADAWASAARLEGNVRRWTAAARTAEATRQDVLRLEALQGLVAHAEGPARLEALKRLARAEGARGALDTAEAAWREAWEADPADTEPDVAIEALLVARSDYAALAEHLGGRIDRLASRGAAAEALRAVRLRRAAILEQRLGLLPEACAELERVLVESPGHASALRWLADLYERQGEISKALPALEKLARSAAPPAERRDAGLRLARALLVASDRDRAKEVVHGLLAESPGSSTVLELRLELARAGGPPAELGDALEALARVSGDEPRVRSEMLVEAAQAAARAGDTEASLERAREAARLAPDVASTQLFARGLEYRLRGPGEAEDARVTVAALSPLLEGPGRPGLAAEDVALGTFLLAEARDVLEAGTGEAVLRTALGEIGPQPLVALGLAERTAARSAWDSALRFYAQALEGNLLGLRRAGRVALAAATVAESAARPEIVARLLEEAALDPETRVEALVRQARIARAAGDAGKVRELLRAALPALEEDARAVALAEIARALFESRNPSDRLEADRSLREAIDAASPELAVKLRAELGGHRMRPLSSIPAPDVPPPPSDLGASAPPPAVSKPPPLPARASVAPRASVPPPLPPAVRTSAPPRRSSAPPDADIAPPSWRFAAPLEATPAAPLVAVITPERPAEGHSAHVEAARALLSRGDREAAEKVLGEAMRDGSIAAADLLDELLCEDPARTSSLAKVRRHAAELVPGDLGRLHRLRDAARADQNPSYVRAIEHVLRAFGPSEARVPPPPLGAQRAQPGMLGMLARHSGEPAGEALACVWEGARGVFTKPLTAYGTSGVARVQPGPTSALSRLYEVALRLLDTPRFALFHEKTREPLRQAVALLESPSAVLYGDVSDELELKWVFGRALASVLPENALSLGLPDGEGRLLWRVLVSAFGPAGLAQPFDKVGATLADSLWQTLTPRVQRRVSELLARGGDTPYELVVERAQQSGRRVAMFLSGDFAHAARTTLVESGVASLESELGQEGGLARACAALPALADLYRLAVRPEYADARWHVPPPTSARFAIGPGLPVV